MTFDCREEKIIGRLGIRRFLCCLFLVTFWPGLVWGQTETAPPWPEVPAGIEYIHQRIGENPWSIHVLKVDRAKKEFQLVSSLAQNKIFDLAPLSEQIRQLPRELGKPAAGVNGDFFVIRQDPYRGDPLGLQIVRGELISAPTDISFWIDPKGNPHIGELVCGFRVTGPDGLDMPIGLNQQRLDDTAVLYTPTLGPSTRTTTGRELVLEKVDEGFWLPLRAGVEYKARVREINDKADTPLTPEIMVLSIGPELLKSQPAMKEGAVVTLTMATRPDLKGVETALGGRPILLTKGKAPEKWPNLARHPRTVLGWNERSFYMVVVDGRQEGLSMGMTYPELAEMMLRFGCTEAVNIDGGGSSTFWLGGKIMNSPSDGRERSIANGLIVVQKKKEKIKLNNRR